MMTHCPKCDSTEIVSDISVFANVGGRSGAVFVSLVDPSGKGETVSGGFRADVCGKCGYTEFYSKKASALLEAHNKNYVAYKP